VSPGTSWRDFSVVGAAEARYVRRAVQMSVDLVVYMARSAMPEPTVWARAIVSEGFPAELDCEFNVDSFAGLLRCRYDGADAGFEYYSTSATPDGAEDLPANVDFSVTFATGSSMRELASSVVSAAVLLSGYEGRPL